MRGQSVHDWRTGIKHDLNTLGWHTNSNLTYILLIVNISQWNSIICVCGHRRNCFSPFIESEHWFCFASLFLIAFRYCTTCLWCCCLFVNRWGFFGGLYICSFTLGFSFTFCRFTFLLGCRLWCCLFCFLNFGYVIFFSVTFIFFYAFLCFYLSFSVSVILISISSGSLCFSLWSFSFIIVLFFKLLFTNFIRLIIADLFYHLTKIKRTGVFRLIFGNIILIVIILLLNILIRLLLCFKTNRCNSNSCLTTDISCKQKTAQKSKRETSSLFNHGHFPVCKCSLFCSH